MKAVANNGLEILKFSVVFILIIVDWYDID